MHTTQKVARVDRQTTGAVLPHKSQITLRFVLCMNCSLSIAVRRQPSAVSPCDHLACYSKPVDALILPIRDDEQEFQGLYKECVLTSVIASSRIVRGGQRTFSRLLPLLARPSINVASRNELEVGARSGVAPMIRYWQFASALALTGMKLVAMSHVSDVHTNRWRPHTAPPDVDATSRSWEEKRVLESAISASSLMFTGDDGT